MRKTVLAVLLTISMVISAFSMTGCGDSKEASNEGAAESTDLLETIKERGTMVIATEGTWSPWT